MLKKKQNRRKKKLKRAREHRERQKLSKNKKRTFKQFFCQNKKQMNVRNSLQQAQATLLYFCREINMVVPSMIKYLVLKQT